MSNLHRGSTPIKLFQIKYSPFLCFPTHISITLSPQHTNTHWRRWGEPFMARVPDAHSSPSTVTCCTAQCVHCVLGFINLGVNRVPLRPVELKSIIYFFHKAPIHVHLIKTHRSIPLTQNRLFWLNIYRTSMRMETRGHAIFPLQPRNMKPTELLWNALQKTENILSLNNQIPSPLLSFDQIIFLTRLRQSFLLVISLEFTSDHKHFDLELCWSHVALSAGWAERNVWAVSI